MPDGNPKYRLEPRPESVQTFIKYVSAKSVVTRIQHQGGLIYEIVRPSLGNIRAFLTNIYIVGEADIYEIISNESNLDAIVTMSAWNSYTHQAKELAKQQRIGLFKFKEFMGAIFYVGQRFLDYVLPKR